MCKGKWFLLILIFLSMDGRVGFGTGVPEKRSFMLDGARPVQGARTDGKPVLKVRRFRISPEFEGKAIDIRKLYQDLKDRSSNLSDNPIQINTFDYPPIVTAADLELQLEDIKEKLNQTIVLNFENFNFNLKLMDHN